MTTLSEYQPISHDAKGLRVLTARTIGKLPPRENVSTTVESYDCVSGFSDIAGSLSAFILRFSFGSRGGVLTALSELSSMVAGGGE